MERNSRPLLRGWIGWQPLTFGLFLKIFLGRRRVQIVNLKNLTLIFALSAFVFSVPQFAHSQGLLTTMLSNGSEPAGGSVFYGSDLWIAQPFETGNISDGYTLGLCLISGSGAFSSSLSIYSDNNGTPENSIGLGGLALSPSTTYWIVATASTPAQSSGFPSCSWSYASDNNYSSSSDNWSINPTFDLSTDGSNWASYATHSPFQFLIVSTPVPEPSTCSLTGLGFATIFLCRKKYLPRKG
jgi:hypothetical protein